MEGNGFRKLFTLHQVTNTRNINVVVVLEQYSILVEKEKRGDSVVR